MSIARVTTVKRSNKPYVCGKCKDDIPKGSEYRWYKVGFRSRYRNIRCMKSECTPRQSELDASKMSEVWGAQEDFEASLSSAESEDDLRSALDDYAAVLRQVGEEYREAGTNEHGVEWQPENIERADMLESAADEVENIDFEERDDCPECDGTGSVTVKDETKDCAECDGTGKAGDEETWLDEQREAARAALEVELP